MSEINESDPKFYDVLYARRDVRGQFVRTEPDELVLDRILRAANAAPSVGLSQPWDFILVRNRATRDRFRDHVLECGERFAATLPPERSSLFSRIRIEGISDAALGVVVTYDADRGAPAVLGRHTIADAGVYSVCLAIQNLWLAATVEGWGVGWVSFYEEDFLRELVRLPERIKPVAWLCVGPITHLETRPDLERAGWRKRAPLEHLVHDEVW
jgi:5,6-dimethylbenzimidazole synthase